MKYRFVEGPKPKRRRQPKSFKFKGTTSSTSEKREQAKTMRNELADCLISMAQEWEKYDTPLEEAKQQVLACADQAESEGANSTEMRRMRLIINGDGEKHGIMSMDELIKYVYNYSLRTSGLSVNRIFRGK